MWHSVHLDASKVILGFAHFQEFTVLAGSLLLVDDDVVPHEAQEPGGVVGGRHSRNARTMSEHRVLQEVLQLLVEVVVLQVVNDADMVDVATTPTEELVSTALEARSDQGHLT